MPKVQGGDANGGGRGRRSRSRVASSLSEINVVPLVDVMLVLLIIFMITAPMMHRGLDVNLPVATRSAQLASERVFVTVPLSYQQDRVVQLGEEMVRVDVLDERVRQSMLSRTDKEIYVRGDGGVTLQQLMEVMDKLKEGGVERVGLLSRLPGER